MSALEGADIAKVLSSSGPVVKCVLLKAGRILPNTKPAATDDNDHKNDNRKKPPPSTTHPTTSDSVEAVITDNTDEIDKEPEEEPIAEKEVLLDLIEEVEIDTTPAKNMVAKTLGGPFTFLGQYEDEGIVLMVRRQDGDDDDGDEGDVVYEDGVSNAVIEFDRQAARDELHGQSLSELRNQCRGRKISMEGMLEKEEVIESLLDDMERKALASTINPHQLQPPLHNLTVRGDILVMKVAEVEETLDEDVDDENDDYVNGNDDDDDESKEDDANKEDINNDDEGEEKETQKEDSAVVKDDDEDAENETSESPKKEVTVPSNEEFFLDYTLAEYVAFASRTDIVEEEDKDGDADEEQGGEEDDEQEEESGDEQEEEAYVMGGDDEDEPDEEDKAAMLNLVMNEVLRQYREENGRGPDTRELLEIRSAVAKQLDVEVPDVDEVGADWNEKAPPRIINQIGGNGENITNGKKRNRRIAFTPDTKEVEAVADPDKEEEEEAEDDETQEPQAKKRKPSPPQDDCGDDDSDDERNRKPAAVEASSSSKPAAVDSEVVIEDPNQDGAQ